MNSTLSLEEQIEILCQKGYDAIVIDSCALEDGESLKMIYGTPHYEKLEYVRDSIEETKNLLGVLARFNNLLFSEEIAEEHRMLIDGYLTKQRRTSRKLSERRMLPYCRHKGSIERDVHTNGKDTKKKLSRLISLQRQVIKVMNPLECRISEYYKPYIEDFIRKIKSLSRRYFNARPSLKMQREKKGTLENRGNDERIFAKSLLLSQKMPVAIITYDRDFLHIQEAVSSSGDLTLDGHYIHQDNLTIVKKTYQQN